MTITLTGQSMIRGDTRADAPEAVPTIQALITGEIALTNFEAAVFDPRKGQTMRDGRFASPPEAMEALQAFGFNMLALPNNHSFDINVHGIVNTLETAERLGIGHAGAGRNNVEADQACVVQTSKGTVALVAVASGLVANARATETRPGVNELAITGATPDEDDVRRILHRVRDLEEPIMWESVVAHVEFEGDKLKAVRFQPIAMNKVGRGLPNPHDELDVNEYHRTRGLPRPATGNQARFLLERFAQLSTSYGTEIAIEGSTAALVLHA